MVLLSPSTAVVAALALFAPLAASLGQKKIISFKETEKSLQLAGGDGTGQILVSADDYWGVIRAAGDLAVDFGRVTGTNFTLSSGKEGASPASYSFEPVDISDNTVYKTTAKESFSGPSFADPDAANTVIIAGTIGHSAVIDKLIDDGKIEVSEVEGKWEAFTSVLVDTPVKGCDRALVIAGSDPRGTIFGIYDVSEQIGVSPWYFWTDVPVRKHKNIYALDEGKVQKSPSVKYRGFFLNDEQPGLTNWVATNWPDAWNDAAGYNHHFHALVFELLLRLRANYFWPTLWGSIFYADDPLNQPLADAYEIVLGSSHTEPVMRAQNEFKTYYKGEWAYNLNNETIDEYFRYGAQRAKPYSRNSLWTMAMRGTGDTEIEGGLGLDALLEMLEILVHQQQAIIGDVLGVEVNAETVPSMWCLYKEVQTYQEKGLVVPEDITLLWADDNWGNVRRLPILNETSRSGGAGVYYHFDYVGDPRDYKWINTIQLEKTAEQMHLAYARQADRIWVVNVGDLKPLELPISHFLDLAYDAEYWTVDSTTAWIEAWATREFGDAKLAPEITELIIRYGMYAARRKYELIVPQTYSVLHYNEADAIVEQWKQLAEDAQAVSDKLDDAAKDAFFQVVLQPALGGYIVNEIYVTAAKNSLYAGQKRNAANDLVAKNLRLLAEDANLTARWDRMLDGKWKHMLDQTHINYDGYWQQPMRNTLPPMQYVQNSVMSLAGHVGVGVEGSNGTVPGDDQYHSNSGNELTLPPLDPYGPSSRYFEVFWRGTDACEWNASPEVEWLKLSKTKGKVGPGGEDTRVLVSVDWDKVPEGTKSQTVYINVTTPCRGLEKYAYREPKLLVPVEFRSVPESFGDGFVEADGVVAIEGPNYQAVVPGTSEDESIEYHTFENYGRTMGAVGLLPLSLEKLALGEGPALEYKLYLWSKAKANVTIFLSPSQNYLGNEDLLEYAVTLFPEGQEQPEPQRVTPVSISEGTAMPIGWQSSVADAVWGLTNDLTTSTFDVEEAGVYTLRIWALMPSVNVQKIIVNLGGRRPSYLGPPESFLVGRDKKGEYDGTSFRRTAGIIGGA